MSGRQMHKVKVVEINKPSRAAIINFVSLIYKFNKLHRQKGRTGIMLNKLGRHLEQLRLNNKLSLRAAAARSGLSYTYIRDVELGINRKTKKEVTPSPATLKKLATAYGADYFDLLEIAGIVPVGYNVR